MSDLLPMLAGTPDEFEALLLRSADDDEPDAGALERVGAALGVGASALALGSAGSAVAGHAATAGSATALAKQLTLLSLVKWLTVGVAAGFATGGVAHLATREPPPAPHLAAPVVAAVPGERGVVRRSAPVVALPAQAAAVATTLGDEPAQVLAAPAAPGLAVVPAPAKALLDTPAVGPSSASFAPLEEPPTARARTTSTVAATPASQLGEETKTLDRVRADLTQGRTAEALAGLERYRATFAHGALAAEATLLRVDALLRSGQRAAAQREANTLLQAAPESRYASRARALLAK